MNKWQTYKIQRLKQQLEAANGMIRQGLEAEIGMQKTIDGLRRQRFQVVYVLGKALKGIPQQIVLSFLFQEFISGKEPNRYLCYLVLKEVYDMHISEAKEMMDKYEGK